MGRICVITLDHNASTVARREGCVRDNWQRVSELRVEGLVDEYLQLQTCNRSELYLVLPDNGEEPRVADLLSVPGARTLFDYDAVRHLLRVLLGLESMAKGESHIVSQVKGAYASAPGCGKVLHRLFQRAIGMAATLRTCYHPGREPSLPYIATNYLLEKRTPAGGRHTPRALVVGLGALGQETANVLLSAGCEVYVTNRTVRKLDKKLARCIDEGWEGWKTCARACDAVFLCTSAAEPLLLAAEEDAMPDTWVIDLGSPHQSEPRNGGVRITLDDMNEIAGRLLTDYNRLLGTLEEEAEKAGGALLTEVSVLTDETWKHLALARAQALARERAAAKAGRLGVDEAELAAFGASVMKAFLHPLISAPIAHSARAWRILSGEHKEYEEE